MDEAALQAAFAPFGDIVNVLIPADTTTKRHRGFGFVEFEETVTFFVDGCSLVGVM